MNNILQKENTERFNVIIMKRTKLLKKNYGLSVGKVAIGKTGKKPKPYPVPEEDSFMPIDEDSEEIKYQTKKNVF
jgi:hypothetical protein